MARSASARASGALLNARHAHIAPVRHALLHKVELDPEDECVVVDRAGVRGSATKRLTVGLPRQANIGIRDRRERHELDGVDLDRRGPDGVSAPDADLRSAPQPD
jgi:hypothetical protein